MIPAARSASIAGLALLAAALWLSPAPSAAATEGDPASGGPLFEQHCGGCHGIGGAGGRGPNLRRPVLAHAANVQEIRTVIITGIAPDMPAIPFLSDTEVADLAAYVHSIGQVAPQSLPGDAARGRAVFEHSGCPACHIMDGQGNGYGPELSRIGAERGGDRLRQTLLDPKSTIAPDFLYVEVVTESGRTIRGIRRNEDTLTIQIQDAAGDFHSLVKARLRALTRLRGETPMPAFDKKLSKRQLEDVVAYLAQQGQHP
jgi:putative heme-binding domain-containing protein